MVNLHLPPNVDHRGVPWTGRDDRVQMYDEALRKAVGTVAAEEAYGQVFVVGDVNVDYRRDAVHRTPRFPWSRFHAFGFASEWAGADVSGGTQGNRLIDQVWAQSAPTRYRIFDYSDHKPATARYDLL